MTLLLDSAHLEVVLSVTERALSFHKGNVSVDRQHIVKVQLTDDAWNWLRGVPSPGSHVRGVLAMGVWSSGGGDDFVIVRRRKPAVVIDLEGDPKFQRLVLTTRHGLALVQALHLETDATPTEVTEIVTASIPVLKPPSNRRTPRPAPAI